MTCIFYNKPPLKRGKGGSVFLMRETEKGYSGWTPIKWWFCLILRFYRKHTSRVGLFETVMNRSFLKKILYNLWAWQRKYNGHGPPAGTLVLFSRRELECARLRRSCDCSRSAALSTSACMRNRQIRYKITTSKGKAMKQGCLSTQLDEGVTDAF